MLLTKKHLWPIALIMSGCAATPPESPEQTPSGTQTSPIYVLANEIYTGDATTSYVNILNSLDTTEIDYDKAVEYGGGRATISTYNGWLFVAGPEAPVVTRFSVDKDGKLVEEGAVSFANYGMKSLVIDEWSINFISPVKAYLMNWDDGRTLVWNPTTMEITGEIAPPTFQRGTGVLNGSTGIVRGNRLFRTFFWNDWDTYTTSAEQYLVVYDVENDSVVEIIGERRCPGLGNRISADADGTLYFSNWIWNVTETLVKKAPSSCALRINAGENRFDPTWVLDFKKLTGGREGAMLNILPSGKALLSAFHQERATFDASTDPSELAGTDNWRLWNVDLTAETAAPLDGVEWMAGAASTFTLDGRSFIFVPGEGWSTTRIHELKNGQAQHVFDVRGWSFQFHKLR